MCAIFTRGTLPKAADADPEWREGAVFARDELEQLISDERLLPDRRVLYALKGLAGLRHGEAAGLRWKDYDATLLPLARIFLPYTKTKVPRKVPAHPALMKMLGSWWSSGWEATFGRPPTAEDLIVPTRNFTVRPPADAQRLLLLDLKTLTLRPRRGHDLRRTFISLALVDGSRRDLLETISHGPRGDMISVYSTFPWDALCAEVAKLKIREPKGELVPMELATKLATVARSVRLHRGTHRPQKQNPALSSGVLAVPTGVENARDTAKQRQTAVKPGSLPPAEAVSRCLEGADVARLATALADAIEASAWERALVLTNRLRQTLVVHQLPEPRLWRRQAKSGDERHAA